MWDTYTEEFQNYFNSLDRAAQTAIINGSMEMKNGRYENRVMKSYQMNEEVQLGMMSHTHMMAHL